MTDTKNINRTEDRKMIYDTPGLEQHYDDTIAGILEILHELNANHDHINKEDVQVIGHAYGLLRMVQRRHAIRLDKWCKNNS